MHVGESSCLLGGGSATTTMMNWLPLANHSLENPADRKYLGEGTGFSTVKDQARER